MFASPDQPLDGTWSAAGALDSSPAARLMQFINSRINFERLPAERYNLQDFKLDRMRELLRLLGDPQLSLSAVHIAGTKGKGSTAAMTAAMLAAAGHRVGLFTSPHLNSVGERMTINGVLPSEDDLNWLLTVVPAVVEDMDALGPSMRPTFFECITAMAWMHFARNNVDLVVLEVGLGGRLDATNVCAPRVTAITSISRDHERLLGSTLGQIAAEKAGIIKPGIPVLSGVGHPEPREVIRAEAARVGAPLFEIDRELFWSPVEQHPAENPLEPLTIDIASPWRMQRVRLPLPGHHQGRNALLAVSICDVLSHGSFPCPGDAIERGLSQLHWPLRIEVLGHKPLVIVDAAHNDGSIDALAETLSTIRRRTRWLIFATSKDKDAGELLRRLNDHFDEVVLTRFLGNPRSISLDVLRERARACLSIPYEVADTPTEAWQRVRYRANDDDLVCVTGSFFLAAEMRTIILDDIAGNLPATQVPEIA